VTLIELGARALCKERGYDPDQLEPGDLPCVDGRNAKGEPCHFLWRDFAPRALLVLKAIREPTQTMLDAAWKADDYVGAEWTVMLDAELAVAEASLGPKGNVGPASGSDTPA
jgi:hypothetical protein